MAAELLAAVDAAADAVAARTSGRFLASWHRPDDSLSTEGFDVGDYADLQARSTPLELEGADGGAGVGTRGQLRHMLALRDSQVAGCELAGYAKIKLLNRATLAPATTAALEQALVAEQEAGGAEAAGPGAGTTAGLGGGIAYIGCVVVRPRPAVMRTAQLLSPPVSCAAPLTRCGVAAVSPA